MAVNTSRSQRMSLIEGTTDGKYRKSRPDTQVADMSGNAQTLQDRSHLHAPMNYGFPADELPVSQRAVPGM